MTNKFSGHRGPIDDPILPTQCRGKCREERDETIERLVNERDTARRMYCSEVDNTRPQGIYAEDIAKSMGWDCYSQNTKGIPDAES